MNLCKKASDQRGRIENFKTLQNAKLRGHRVEEMAYEPAVPVPYKNGPRRMSNFSRVLVGAGTFWYQLFTGCS